MSYLKIAEHYKQCFKKYGATPKGLDWDNQENLNKRYEIMSQLIKNKNSQDSILDFGCGYGGFYLYLTDNFFNLDYSGLDINEEAISSAYKEYPYPAEWYNIDINSDELKFTNLSDFDYIVCNGTFTVKNTLTQEQMWEFMTSTIKKLWTKTNKGIAFNVMSKLVDWERDDLFHVSIDELGWYLKNNLSRNFIIRNDYRLYEYTVYVYK